MGIQVAIAGVQGVHSAYVVFPWWARHGDGNGCQGGGRIFMLFRQTIDMNHSQGGLFPVTFYHRCNFLPFLNIVMILGEGSHQKTAGEDE